MMAYTVKKLAEVSGVSVRTLHWYDEVGLLNPAYHGSNGYRYYEEDQLLLLQQILFFRELGFELKQIQKILKRTDFDKQAALRLHRKALLQNIAKTKQLIKTIDKTLEHMEGISKMKEKEMFSGFSKEQQAEYERQIIERFGEAGKIHIEESKKNIDKLDPKQIKKEFDAICNKLIRLLDKKPEDKEVQAIIRTHFTWISQFWKPTKETYGAHGRFILDSDLRKAYETYDQRLPRFIAEAIQIFAKKEL